MTVSADGVRPRAWLERAAAAPATLPEAGYASLLEADGEELEQLCALADRLRESRVGNDITFAANRNLDPNLTFTDPALLTALLEEAWALGATEVCMQGPLTGSAAPDALPQVLAAVRGTLPAVHLHAFRPAEIADGAARMGVPAKDLLDLARELGLGSIPGTGARILDDAIRATLTDGTDIPAQTWIEIVETAHRCGLPSTATMVYGHLETPAQTVAHLRALAEIQARTGGFTELILMPLGPAQVPPGIRGRVRLAGERKTRAVHAVARLMLDGLIDHLQAPWPKVGLATAAQLLRGGADDLGGILLDGRLAPEAGPEAGISLDLASLESLASKLGRPLRQRGTLYGEVGTERQRALREAAS